MYTTMYLTTRFSILFSKRTVLRRRKKSKKFNYPHLETPLTYKTKNKKEIVCNLVHNSYIFYFNYKVPHNGGAIIALLLCHSCKYLIVVKICTHSCMAAWKWTNNYNNKQPLPFRSTSCLCAYDFFAFVILFVWWFVWLACSQWWHNKRTANNKHPSYYDQAKGPAQLTATIATMVRKRAKYIFVACMIWKRKNAEGSNKTIILCCISYMHYLYVFVWVYMCVCIYYVCSCWAYAYLFMCKIQQCGWNLFTL